MKTKLLYGQKVNFNSDLGRQSEIVRLELKNWRMIPTLKNFCSHKLLFCFFNL